MEDLIDALGTDAARYGNRYPRPEQATSDAATQGDVVWRRSIVDVAGGSLLLGEGRNQFNVLPNVAEKKVQGGETWSHVTALQSGSTVNDGEALQAVPPPRPLLVMRTHVTCSCEIGSLVANVQRVLSCVPGLETEFFRDSFMVRVLFGLSSCSSA